MRSLKDNMYAIIDLGVVLMVGIAFAGLTVIAYLIFKVRDQLVPTRPLINNANNASSAAWNTSWLSANNTVGNITGGFDDAVNLLLVAITIFIKLWKKQIKMFFTRFGVISYCDFGIVNVKRQTII